MSEILPINWEDKVNSPELLAFLQQFGNQHYLSAEEINQLRDAINQIYSEGGGGAADKIITQTGWTLVDNVLTIHALWIWLLNAITNSNALAQEETIPYTSADGYERLDVLVANDSDGFEIIQGTESNTGIVIAETVPDDKLYITTIKVSFTTVGIDPPIVGDQYVRKSERAITSLNLNSLASRIPLNGISSNVELTGTVEQIDGIATLTNENLYNGKPLFIRNGQISSFILTNEKAGEDYKFSFPSGADLTLNAKELIEFKLRITGVNTGVYNFVGISSTGGGGYNYFKGVFLTEAALISAHPTGIAGDRAQVNEVGATLVINYSWDAEDGVWVEVGSTSGGPINSDALPEGSTNLYFTTARVLAWILSSLFPNTPAKSTSLVDADKILIGDSEDSDKTKTRTFAQLKANLVTYLSDLFSLKTIPVFEIGANTTLTNTHVGGVIYITTSCTITLPNGLMTGFGVSIVTLAGATLTLAIGGSVVLFNNAGTTMTEKLSCTIQNRTTANNYVIMGNL